MRPPAAEAALFSWVGGAIPRQEDQTDPASSCSKRGVKIWQKGWGKEKEGSRGGDGERNKSFALHSLVLAYEKASTTCKKTLFFMGKSGSQGQWTACTQTLEKKGTVLPCTKRCVCII